MAARYMLVCLESGSTMFTMSRSLWYFSGVVRLNGLPRKTLTRLTFALRMALKKSLWIFWIWSFESWVTGEGSFLAEVSLL